MAGRMLFFLVAGPVTVKIAVEALALMPAIFLGRWLGTRFFYNATAERFWAALQGLLVCGALILLGKGLAKIRQRAAIYYAEHGSVGLDPRSVRKTRTRLRQVRLFPGEISERWPQCIQPNENKDAPLLVGFSFKDSVAADH
jgi:hypothetical protein